MISVDFEPALSYAAELVTAALQRSVGGLAVGVNEAAGAIALRIGPCASPPRRGPRKAIHFGKMSTDMRRRFRVADRAGVLDAAGADAPPARANESTESDLAVQYSPMARRLGGGRVRRPFARYDFQQEWNNLGYGAIRADGSIWGVAEQIEVGEAFEIGYVASAAGKKLCSYAALLDDDEESVLWFNRSVGPIDSFEWRLVEVFLSGYRADSSPVCPVIAEIPYGHDALVVSRLDCDEDIDSARPLANLYDELGVPLSLAVKTALLGDGPQPFLERVAQVPGAVLSHSATHPAHWGDSYERAFDEATISGEALKRAVGVRPRYAVSPFHQTPAFALRALADAGYAGCIGGSISGDPAFNLARGGVLAGGLGLFVGQTAQCMLHGDCLQKSGDPVKVYRDAFELALATGSVFSFLDHPFSPRYRYGWRDEDERGGAHLKLIEHIKRRTSRPLFLSAGAAMDFAAARARVWIEPTQGGFCVQGADDATGLQVGVELRGRQYRAASGLCLT